MERGITFRHTGMKNAPFYIVAGEASGDLLGAHIIEAFPHTYVGMGGDRMSENPNFAQKFDSRDVSVMGLIEVLPQVPRLFRLINATVQDILNTQPCALITIDAPDFNQRVVRKLKKHPTYKRNPFPCIHVGAPTVWAWRPARAKTVAKLWDELWTLFPFEPPYFPDLPTYFIGHPFGDPLTDIPLARESRTCLLLPGSRAGEIKRHWPLLKAVCERHTEFSYALLTLPHLIPLIEECGGVPSHCTLHTEYDMRRAHIALAASGTVSLELARAGTPMITFYKMNAITAFILRRLVRTPYANLVNILLQKFVVPELIQEKATVDYICHELTQLHQPQNWQIQHKNLEQAISLLRGSHGLFSANVAERLKRF